MFLKALTTPTFVEISRLRGLAVWSSCRAPQRECPGSKEACRLRGCPNPNLSPNPVQAAWWRTCCLWGRRLLGRSSRRAPVRRASAAAVWLVECCWCVSAPLSSPSAPTGRGSTGESSLGEFDLQSVYQVTSKAYCVGEAMRATRTLLLLLRLEGRLRGGEPVRSRDTPPALHSTRLKTQVFSERPFCEH